MNEIKQIETLIDRYKDAVDTQDSNAFRALWSTKTPTMMVSVGQAFSGVDAICEDFLIGRVKQRNESIRIVPEDLQVRQIRDDLAVVLFSYHADCILRETHEPFVMRGMETQLMELEDGEWKLVHVHYSKI